MRGPHNQSRPVAIARVFLAALLAPLSLSAQTPIPQREQVEQAGVRKLSLDASWTGKKIGGIGPSENTGTDDAFGAQSILRERPDQRSFQASLENAAFYTSNAALSSADERDDTLLNTSLALGWRRGLTDRLTASLVGRYGLFRYNRFPVLDFQSLDAEASLILRLPLELEMLAGYGYTQFTSRTDFREFYGEHAFNLSLQRIFEISRAHFVIAGISARWNWAKPEFAQRDRYSAYLGYHLRATDHLTANLSYRYAFFDYRDGGTGRGDHNHSISLSLRYSLREWMSVGASFQGTWNRSNQAIFSYDAFTLGGSFDLSAQF